MSGNQKIYFLEDFMIRLFRISIILKQKISQVLNVLKSEVA